MKTYLLLFSLLLIYESGLCQTLSSQVVASSGDQIEHPSGLSVSWTLGELSTELLNSQGIKVQQGFQQGNLNIAVGTRSSFLTDDQWQAYPNPAHQFLQISTSFDQSWQYQLFDPLGRLILSGKNNSSLLHLNLPPLIDGLYWVRIQDDSGRIASKKIFIHQ